MPDAGGHDRRRALVIVPTYNERDNVAEVAKRLFEGSDGIDLLIVDDGSPDGTADAVRALTREDPRIHLIARDTKLGLRSACVRGFQWGLERGYDALVQMDADLSHDPGTVSSLLAGLHEADLVIGSRYVAGGRVENWGAFRRRLSLGANIYARKWLRLAVHDATSGFRAYAAEALRQARLETLRSEGYGFQIEMTRRVLRNGGRIIEVPITFTERVVGTSKMTPRIVLEALVNVAVWGLKDRLRHP